MVALDEQSEPAVNIVVAFTTEMNAWERRMHARSRLENGQLVRDTIVADAVASLTYDAVLNEYYVIFRRYCTHRERIYGGFPSSWSRDGKYKGAARSAVFRSELEISDKASVYLRAGDFPDNW